MLITNIAEIKINPYNKKPAYEIYIDEAFAFLLYKQDIEEYQLKVGKEITSELYDKIIEDTVYRRAKQKAMAILKYMDRTEEELFLKLKGAHYTDDIIERTIEYLKGYHYIDDERYASNYIRLKKSTLSLLQIKTKLIQKGINKNILEKLIAKEYDTDENETDPEIEAISKAIKKKYKKITDLTYEDKQKLIASLYRKGFDLDKINRCLG